MNVIQCLFFVPVKFSVLMKKSGFCSLLYWFELYFIDRYVHFNKKSSKRDRSNNLGQTIGFHTKIPYISLFETFLLTCIQCLYMCKYYQKCFLYLKLGSRDYVNLRETENFCSTNLAEWYLVLHKQDLMFSHLRIITFQIAQITTVQLLDMKQHGLHQQVPVIRINVGMERSRNLSLHTGTKVYHYHQGQNNIIFCLKLLPLSLKYP